MFEGNVAVVLIFVIVLTAACYAIYHFKSKPARVVAVIGALAALVGALTPIVRLLIEQPQSGSTTKVEAPATPVPTTPNSTTGEPKTADVGSVRPELPEHSSTEGR
ncbi:hypothetical protein [Streptomyces sp. I5]|uniref:hypothetical protein n=1 Tax=Streptomyces sp. I5 TaxID=2759947 RepID=UPI0018EE756E|nr:hypothetical protein [Streptomyces sp. I5]MBJ6633835.1 hypothetical protein [Streptomyces sp. I5]